MQITTRQYVYAGIGLLVIISISILLNSAFSGRKKPDPFYKESINLINKSLDLLDQSYKVNQKLHDEIIQEKDLAKFKADSLLQAVQNNKSKYTIINNAYKDIPGNIDRIRNNDDAIRSAFSDY